jgi:kynureninase
LLDHQVSDQVTILTPRDPQQRGAQLSLRVKQQGRAVYASLGQANVLCDWREPDVIRVAPVPLYNSFMDIYRFVDILRACLAR